MAAREYGKNRSCQYFANEDNLQDLAGLLFKTVVASQEIPIQSLKHSTNSDVCERKTSVNSNNGEMTSKTVSGVIDASSASRELSSVPISIRKVSGQNVNPFQHKACSLFPQKKKVKLYSPHAEKFLSNKIQCQLLCEQIIKELNTNGICSIDNFLGNELGTAILDEVCDMHKCGLFRDGEVVNNKAKDSSRTVRGDKIIWVDGSEQGCAHIGDLINIVDELIKQCKNQPNNGELGKRNIGERNKAMAACYPGNGAQYVKHVDNPNNDGRCITSIYYLNKGWEEKQGGILRIFPIGVDYVANIKPLFDRLIFFWSDRRNPHEVQASYGTRYAITIWYYDQDELDRHHAKKFGNIKVTHPEQVKNQSFKL